MTPEQQQQFIEYIQGFWKSQPLSRAEMEFFSGLLPKLDYMKAKGLLFSFINRADAKAKGFTPPLGTLRTVLEPARINAKPTGDHETRLPEGTKPATRADIDDLYDRLMQGPDTAMRKVVEKLLNNKKKELHDAELRDQGIKPEDELVERACGKCYCKYTAKAGRTHEWCPACQQEHDKWVEQRLGATDV